MWDADIPNKTKVHVWRLANNGLALGSELQRRSIKAGVLCIACGREETALHRFWSCPHSAHVWEALSQKAEVSIPKPPDGMNNHTELKWWLLDCFSMLNPKELELMCTTIYQLWLARNNARDAAMIENPMAIASRALTLVEEWHEVHSKPAVEASVKQKEKWSPPDEGWLKVNTDGSFSNSDGHGGGGVVVRDHNGAFIAGATHFFPAAVDAEGAEILACRRAVELAKEIGCRNLLLESDCANAVKKLNDTNKDRSVVGPLIEELKAAMMVFDQVQVRAVRRTANVVAHKLAKEGCVNKLCKTWFSSPPDCIVSALVVDSVFD